MHQEPTGALKQTPQNTLVMAMQIPPQLHEKDEFEKERATLNRKLANRVITNHFEGISLPQTAKHGWDPDMEQMPLQNK